MITIIYKNNAYHVYNITLGAIIDTLPTLEQAEALKNKILN